jgi:hypothetical protein
MRKVALLWAVASAVAGCAAPQALAPGAAHEGHESGSLARLETPQETRQETGGLEAGRLAAHSRPLRVPGGAGAPIVGEVPERDPAARGRLAVDMSAADLPDDRDGDGVDQLDLCPELPPDRVDGCPHAR